MGKAILTSRRSAQPHTSHVSQQSFFSGKLFHCTPRLLQRLHDLILDHTSVLQRIIGDAIPQHILKQLSEIEEVPTDASAAHIAVP